MDQTPPRSAPIHFPAPRRHSTVPTSFHPAPPRPSTEQAAAGSVETLYNHPSIRIVAFTAGKSVLERTRPGQEDKPGTLPSSSSFERSIAVGAFQIYRAPGSVAFLRSGSALQPILPKSQAWCLDEQLSKFVLQIRRPNYWRIEVPVGNEEEIKRAQLLRGVLDQILQFEKTPCPFERSFTVELPEPPQTPIKKRTWTPPARAVSMNWPPGQPITPPPEFPSRTRFYTPGARRFSDFGTDASKQGITPAASPQLNGEFDSKTKTPTRKVRLEESAMSRMRLPEEPEPLSPPLTAIPRDIAQAEGNSALRSPDLLIPADSTADETNLKSSDKEQPKPTIVRVPSTANSKVKRIAATSTQTQESITKQFAHYTVQSIKKDPERTMATKHKAPVQIQESEVLEDSTMESDDTLEGSGQLRVRRTRVAAFASRRAAAAPLLRLHTTSMSALNSFQERTTTAEPENPAEPSSPAESMDSFHSVQSWHSALSPPTDSPVFPSAGTFPYPHDNIPLSRSKGKDLSGLLSTPTTAKWDRASTGTVAGTAVNTPNTPWSDVQHDKQPTSPKDETISEASEPDSNTSVLVPTKAYNEIPKENAATGADTDSLSTSWSSAASHTSYDSSNSPMRHRAATTTSVAISHRSPRALSPLPPAANLLTTDITTSRTTSAARAIRRIPSSIFNKTCEILISPPAHLISLMLKVAARITAGEWQGFVFGMDESGEVVDIRWDYGDAMMEHDTSVMSSEGGSGGGWMAGITAAEMDASRHGGSSSSVAGGAVLRRRASDRTSRASFTTTAAESARVDGNKKEVAQYRDPWATPPEGDPDMDEEGHWSRSWGVD